MNENVLLSKRRRTLPAKEQMIDDRRRKLNSKACVFDEIVFVTKVKVDAARHSDRANDVVKMNTLEKRSGRRWARKKRTM